MAWATRRLEFTAGELLFLFGIAQIAELDEDGRHVRRRQHAQRRPAGGPHIERHAALELLLQRAREDRGLIDVADLRLVPQHHFDVAGAAAEDRHALRHELLARPGLVGKGRHQNRCARRARFGRGVRVQTDEEIGLVVVGDRRAVVERHVPVIVAREQDAKTEPSFEQGLHAPRHGQGQVLFEQTLRAFRALVRSAVARVDGDGPNRRGRLAEGRRVSRRQDGRRRCARRRRRWRRRPSRSSPATARAGPARSCRRSASTSGRCRSEDRDPPPA